MKALIGAVLGLVAGLFGGFVGGAVLVHMHCTDRDGRSEVPVRSQRRPAK